MKNRALEREKTRKKWNRVTFDLTRSATRSGRPGWRLGVTQTTSRFGPQRGRQVLLAKQPAPKP